MDNAARARQRVLALFLPIAAVLYISAEALSPRGTDQVITTTATALKVLPIAAKHPAQLYVAGSLALLGLGALAVSYAAIATLVRNRGSAVATVAALIGGIGAFCGAIVNVLVYPDLAAAATAHLSAGAAARFLVTTFNSGFGHGFSYAYFVGIFAAPALMGYALWRSRSVPRWLAVLFFVGLEAAQQQISSGPVIILYMLPFAAAMVLLAARIWQAAALPASQQQPEPTPVPATACKGIPASASGNHLPARRRTACDGRHDDHSGLSPRRNPAAPRRTATCCVPEPGDSWPAAAGHSDAGLRRSRSEGPHRQKGRTWAERGLIEAVTSPGRRPGW